MQELSLEALEQVQAGVSSGRYLQLIGPKPQLLQVELQMEMSARNRAESLTASAKRDRDGIQRPFM